MTTFPLPTLAATINESGVSAPLFEEIYASIIARVQGIYGSDVVISPDSQDGNFLAIFATAVYDTDQMAIAVYNQFSPTTAVGAGLSSIVKINGLAREIASNSSVDVIIVGQAGLTINGGKVRDTNGGNLWDLPDPTSIEANGQVTVTAICEVVGAIQAPAETVTEIATPQPGWQRVSNPFAAIPGAPVETDAALRQRQSVASSLPSRTVIDGINAGLANLPNVQRLKTYENDTNLIDSDGIPPHTIAVVVEGGDALAVCQTIALKKTPGCGTYGVVGEVILDEQGVPNFIKFFPLSLVTVTVEVTLTALLGYTSTIGGLIIQSIADFISTLPIGYSVFLSKVTAASEIPEVQGGLTYDVTKIRLSRSGNFSFDEVGVGFDEGFWFVGLQAEDINILFFEAAQCLTTEVVLIVNPS